MERSGAEPETAPRPDAPKGEAFDTAAVITISAAHGVHDLYPSFLAPLLPLLIDKLGIPLAAAGGLATVLRAGSLAQPFLGLWADRTDTRYFLIATPALTGLCMSLLGLAPTYLSIVLLLAVAGLSSSAFHPAAAAAVTGASGRSWGRGTSIYMTGAKLGLGVGPLFIVSVVTWLGMEMSFVAALPGVAFSLMLYLQFRRRRTPTVRKARGVGMWGAVKAQRRALLLLSGLVTFRAVATVSFVTFYPTYLTGRGATLLFAGLAMTVFELVGALGALAGGTLSDRLGRRRVLLLAQSISGPLLFLTLSSPVGPEGLALLAVAGVAAFSASPVELTLFQELLPGGRSTAAGIWSLLSFEGSLFATLVVGAIADWIGLGPALGLSVLASMLSIPFTLALSEPRRGS